MTKIITVESCADCPHNRNGLCERRNRALMTRGDRWIAAAACPLQDAPDIEALQAVAEAAKALLQKHEIMKPLDEFLDWSALQAALEALE